MEKRVRTVRESDAARADGETGGGERLSDADKFSCKLWRVLGVCRGARIFTGDELGDESVEESPE